MNATTQMKCREWISIFGKNKLQSLQDRCANLFNISLGLITPDNEPITVWSNSSLICEKVKLGNAKSCMRERQRIIKYLFDTHKFVKCTCYMGITNFACPVVYDGEIIAICLGGGIAEDNELGTDKNILHTIPRISREKIDEIINLIDCMVNILSKEDIHEKKDNSIPPEPEDSNVLLLKNKLSMRELEVVSLINKGMSNKEISMELNISEKTVKTHISNILRKLKLKDRLEVILYCKNCVS